MIACERELSALAPVAPEALSAVPLLSAAMIS